MMEDVACSQGHSFQVEPGQAGSQVRCPQCEDVVNVPANVDETLPHHSADRQRPDDPPSISEDAPKVERSSRGWMIWIGVAISAVTATAFVANLAWKKNSTQLSEMATVPADSEQIDVQRRYPSIPGAVSRLPEWLVEDAPFSLTTFTPIPWEENAASLYLEALVEFGGEVPICFPQDQQEQLRKRALEGVRRYGEFLKPWGDDFDRFHSERTAADNAELDKLLAEYESGFDKLANAQKRTKCAFETGIDVESVLPHAQAARQLARVSHLKLVRDLDRGKCDQAIVSIERVLRLSRDLRPRGGTIVQMVAMAIETLVENSMVPLVLNTPSCTPAGYDRLLKTLVDHERLAIDPLSMSVRSEYITLRKVVDDVQHRAGSFAPDRLKEVSSAFAVGDDSIGAVLLLIAQVKSGRRASEFEIRQVNTDLELMLDADYDREIEKVNQYFLKLHDVSQPDYANKHLQLADLEPQINESFFLSLWATPLTTFVEAVERAKTSLHGTQCLVALKRWQLENTGVPPDLKTVVEFAGLDAIPIDLYAHEPLKMNVMDGTPVIYSVGKDGKDDQGRIDWINGQQAGDFIFMLKH